MKFGHGLWAAGWLLSACGPTHTVTGENAGTAGLPGISIGKDHPAPPPSQGAVIFTIASVSPAPAGKSCPVGAAFTGAVPAVADPSEALDNDTYLHHVVDGENAAAVSCTVIGTSSFTFEGQVSSGGRSLTIANGVFDASKAGTASISLADAQALSGALASPGACTVDVEHAGGSALQIKPGSMWAHFSCSSVERPPSDYCKAEGFFVLENCAQD